MGEHFDVVVVGAGLSGIGAGYRLQTECPDRSYVILEARDAIGGTWDLFRYPGVRSDSDMFTLGYQFRPWPRRSRSPTATRSWATSATPPSDSVSRSTSATGTKVVGADWSSERRALDRQLESDGRRAEHDHVRTSSTPAPATTTTTAATRRTSPASRTSPGRSCTRSSGPRTWTTPASASSSSAAARPP